LKIRWISSLRRAGYSDLDPEAGSMAMAAPAMAGFALDDARPSP
jgi:hypothetical protein